MARLLMMEGNTIAHQRKAAESGCRSASAVYTEAIRAHFPDITIDSIHAADRGQTLAPGASMADYDGLVVGGSGLRAFDDSFEVTNQIALLRAFAETGRPVTGSCWGLQIAALAGGGAVAAKPNGREFGFARKLTRSPDGEGHPYLAGKPKSFDAPSIHYDEVTELPSGSVVLCSNAHTPIQGATMLLGKSEVWAVQYHPEFDLAHLSMLITLCADEMIEDGFFETNTERLAYQAKLDALSENPSDVSLAWQLGIDSDVLDDAMRRAEIINWVEHQVLGTDKSV